MIGSRGVLGAAITCVVLFSVHLEGQAFGLRGGLPGAIEGRLESPGGSDPAALMAGGEVLHSPGMVRRFYSRREFAPAWTDEDGARPRVHALLRAVEKSIDEGLRPEDYHQSAIKRALSEISGVSGQPDAGGLSEFDLILTDAFLTLGSHLLEGRIEHGEDYYFIEGDRPDIDMIEVLERAVSTNGVIEALRDLVPRMEGYRALRAALESYRLLASNGGWPEVKGKRVLRRGQKGAGVVQLRRRLAATGDLDRSASRGDFFDEPLRLAVRKFQRRHGLRADGVVGPATRRELNVSVQERIRQIEINMDRLRWLPQDLGQRYLVVNITDFSLELIDGGSTALKMRVIVGTPYSDTPMMSSRLTHIVLNPSWYIPRGIMVEELLPVIRRDPGYLVRHDIVVFGSEGPEAKEIDPHSIDWAGLGPGNFNLWLRQNAGPKNPLGRLKFMFPNPFKVYLHDTPGGELFKRDVRAFSHSCIRLEKPLELADYLLRGDDTWAGLRELLDKGRKEILNIPRPLGIHILYLTAWVSDGRLNFRHDIYGRDAALYGDL